MQLIVFLDHESVTHKQPVVERRREKVFHRKHFEMASVLAADRSIDAVYDKNVSSDQEMIVNLMKRRWRKI
jgi:hypothetical protein